jgi:putative toxin-antitoxin system antitoxin component (TIGR02293 family)
MAVKAEAIEQARAARLDALWSEVLTGVRALTDVETAPSLDRIEMVRGGVPAQVLDLLADRLGVSLEWLYETTGVARSTGDRKRRADERLNHDQSERVMGLLQLVGRVRRMVEESGDPDGFDAARWVSAWLDAPLGSLGGRRPADFMDTADGRALVLSLVGQMQAGSYA